MPNSEVRVQVIRVLEHLDYTDRGEVLVGDRTPHHSKMTVNGLVDGRKNNVVMPVPHHSLYYRNDLFHLLLPPSLSQIGLG